MSKKESGALSVEKTALSRVTETERKSWPSIAFIWSGILICVPALMVGGIVSSGLTIGSALFSMFIGYAVVIVFMIPLGIMGTDLGLPTVSSISRPFGERGSGLIISILIIIAYVGWFGFQAAVCGDSFSKIMTSYLGIGIPAWVSTIIWGGIMLLTAVYGIGMIRYLNMIAVPILILGLLYGLYYGLSMPSASEILSSYIPPAPTTILVGANLTIAGFILGAVTCGDYTRYCKNRKETVIACCVGVIPAGMIVLAIGGILAVLAGTSDLTLVLSNTNLPVLGLLVLILATWTTNTSSAYTAGLAALKTFKLKDDKRATATLVVGILGIALALMGITNYFMGFLTILTNLIPAVAGVALSDYWIFCKGKAENWAPTPGINFVGIGAWACGALGAILLGNFFIPSANAIIISFVIYTIAGKMYYKNNANNVAT